MTTNINGANERQSFETIAAAVPPAHGCCNSWFASLPEGRQAVLRDDKWMLAHAAFDAGRAAAVAVPHGFRVTEEMHVAACKVLTRAHGLDGLPQRMLDAMFAAAPKAEPVPAGGHLPLPLAITSAPERIWLDLGFNPYEEDAHFSNLHDLTWSKDNATGDGIEYVRADRAMRAQAAHAAVAGPSEFPYEQMDAMALARYKVVPSNASMLWSHAVAAGDGTQQLYVGRETECQNMARKFAGAFLDGAFEFHSIAAAPTTQAAPQPAVQQMEEIDAAVEKAWDRFQAALDKNEPLPPPSVHAAAHYGTWLGREAHRHDEPKAGAFRNAARMLSVLEAEIRRLHAELIATHPAAPAAQGGALLSLAEKHGRVLIERCRVGSINGPLRWGIEYGYDDEIASGSTLLAAIDAARSKANEGA